MLVRFLTLVMLTAFLVPSAPVSAEDNAELQRLFDADQNARRDPDMGWDEIDALDEANRAEVLALLARGEIKTGRDYFHAAVILQHGEHAEEIRLAHSFATIANQLGFERATWMQAATWDRLLMYFEQPQWFGTQFTVDDEGKWQLYEVQEGVVTDKQRAAWRVPSLSESKARAKQRNHD